MKKKKRNKKQSQFGKGKWHFWFLLVVTAIGFLTGFSAKGVWGGIAVGVFAYLSPILASVTYPGIRVSKQDLSRFYKL